MPLLLNALIAQTALVSLMPRLNMLEEVLLQVAAPQWSVAVLLWPVAEPQ